MPNEKYTQDDSRREDDRIRGRLDALRTPARAPFRDLNPHVQKNHTLLYDFDESDKAGRRRPWALFAGVAGVALVGVILLAATLGGGGDDSAGGGGPPANTNPPPIEHGAAILGVATPTADRSSATPSAERSATASPEPGVSAEGAIRASSLGVVSLDNLVAFASPIRGIGRIVDRFGTPRGEGYVHAGVDIVPAAGGTAQVLAACEGPVVGVDSLDGYGNFLAIDCGRGWRTVYAQMSEITVKPGDSVHIGVTKLGTVNGSLHFEIRFKGVPTDPASLIDVTTLPTPTPSATATATSSPTKTATKTATAAGSTPTPPPPTSDPSAPPEATPTPDQPTAVPTAAPPTATPTVTPRPPTPTPTIKVAPPTPTPRPVIR